MRTTVTLAELERKAYAEGHTEIAKLIAGIGSPHAKVTVDLDALLPPKVRVLPVQEAVRP